MSQAILCACFKSRGLAYWCAKASRCFMRRPCLSRHGCTVFASHLWKGVHRPRLEDLGTSGMASLPYHAACFPVHYTACGVLTLVGQTTRAAPCRTLRHHGRHSLCTQGSSCTLDPGRSPSLQQYRNGSRAAVACHGRGVRRLRPHEAEGRHSAKILCSVLCTNLFLQSQGLKRSTGTGYRLIAHSIEKCKVTAGPGRSTS